VVPESKLDKLLACAGRSMTPLIPDGCIIVVDSAQNDHSKMDGKIVVAWHKDRD